MKPRTKKALLIGAGVAGVVMVGSTLSAGEEPAYTAPQPTVEASAPSNPSPSTPSPVAKPTAPSTVTVDRVIDGDTFEAGGVKYRVIGIDTADPADPAATAYAETLLTEPVRLEVDPSQPVKDKYGRTLVHVFLTDGSNYGQLMIGQGWAVEYTVGRPHRFQALYRNTQKAAEPKPVPESGDVYYRTCAEARQDHTTPLHEGEPGYRSGLDGDGDGTACEG